MSGVALLARGRNQCQMLNVPHLAVDQSVSCAPIDTLAEFSADGSRLAVVEKEGIRVLATEGGQPVFSQPRPQVHAIHLSPKGTFLVTWEKLVDGAEEGNLRVWHVASGALASHFKQKVLGEKSAWPAIAWSADEMIAFRLVTNEVCPDVG